MEKYLLINNYTNYSYDDDEITSNVYVLGDYDSIEKCIDACENELVGQARENAEGMFELDDADEELITQEMQEYIDTYVRGYTLHHLDDDDFARVGANRYIYEHWYEGGNYKVENQFMVVRIN